MATILTAGFKLSYTIYLHLNHVGRISAAVEISNIDADLLNTLIYYLSWGFFFHSFQRQFDFDNGKLLSSNSFS